MFFSYLRSVLKPYLEKYQSNDPLVLIMASQYLDVIKTLMPLFTNQNMSVASRTSSSSTNSTLKITMQRNVISSLDVLLNLNLTNYKKTDQIDEILFYMNESGKTFVVSVIEKLKSRFLVGSSCLDPSSFQFWEKSS